MKNKLFNFHTLMRLTVVAAMFIAGALVYNRLPDQIPVHWNINGVADNWGSKTTGLLIIPGVSLLMIVLFPLLSRIDPKYKNYKLFGPVWEAIQTVIIAFMAYIFALQIYFTLNPSGVLFGKLMMGGVGMFFMVMGLLIRHLKQNYFVGFRTPWAIEDPVVWEKSQKFAGWAMTVGGAIFLLDAFVWKYILTVFIGVLVGILVVPTVYSYLVSRK